ncbi:MAG: glycosyltransferase family 39 protein, partial [Chloroflexi bacterium]|nr:glycosyltransferase family 39 protein [Chloroflexota bacterium]
MFAGINQLGQGRSGHWLRLAVIGAAVLIFFAQAFSMARSFDVTMDEGTYLLKGFLFLKGDYTPFEDYGLWTNKMPLAFYIPGLSQYLFLPGLQTGRYFSIFLSALMLLGLWLTVRRNAGQNWASLALLVFALNTGTAYYYMQAITQVITATLLVWALYFLLGEGRTRLELGLGALLMVLVVFTRQNLLTVLPFAFLFIFWQHGWRRGWPAVMAAVIVFACLHLPYWPNIAQTWLEWLPRSLKRWIGYSTLFPSAGVTPIARQ